VQSAFTASSGIMANTGIPFLAPARRETPVEEAAVAAAANSAEAKKSRRIEVVVIRLETIGIQ
jgi:hypothetical protein